MKKLSARQKQIVEDIIDYKLEDCVEISKNYSGRFMYGEECFGIVTGQYLNPSSFLSRFVLMLLDEGERDLAYELSKNVREDNMGLGSIIYFPKFQWEGKV